ncbi:MAG: dessication-associated protein [Chlorobi bacterium]|nr:dessication-associated protein [Chlorobiota bacterium]
METKKSMFDELDPEIVNRVVSRRDALFTAGKVGIGLALVSVPVTFGLLSTKAFAKSSTPTDVIEVLNYALKLEYLENRFYATATTSSGLIPGSDSAVFAQIAKHEAAHVALLKGAITQLGGTPIAEPTFNYTKNFPDVFTNYQTFLAVSQGFEDTGVRAYKGRAADLFANNKDVLQTALQIHSVEARHAAVVRRLRGQKGWISGNDRGGLPAAAQPIYNGEEIMTHLGITVTSSEAYDEPLTPTEVNAIVSLFE